MVLLGLSAKQVWPWSQKPGTLFSNLKFGGESSKLLVFMVLFLLLNLKNDSTLYECACFCFSFSCYIFL